MTIIRLDLWSVHYPTSDGYTAPELLPRVLVGYCYGHPRKSDGGHVQTTRIVSVKGRIVTTSSGSTYRLGRIDPKYRAFLRAQGWPYNRHTPIQTP